MALDFNSAEKQTAGGLIPKNTIVPVHMTLRPGGFGDGGYLKKGKTSNAMMLDAEFTVIEGPFARRKFWTLFTVEGETDGQKKAADISRSKIRAMLESARGVKPSDESDAAVNARRINSFADLDGLRFVAVVGVEDAKDGYDAKNVFSAAVTPDRKDWLQIQQVQRTGPATSAPAAANTQAPTASGGKPAWAS